MKAPSSWLVGLSLSLTLAVACGDDEKGTERPNAGGDGGAAPGGAGGGGGEAGGDVTTASGNGGEPATSGGEAGAATTGGSAQGGEANGGAGGEPAGAPGAGGSDGGTAPAGGAPASGGSAGEAPCPTGSERCECYGNGTCDAGLTCLSDLCVDAGQGGEGGAAGAGGVPSTGEGGASGEGGAGGEGGEPPIGSLEWENGWWLDDTTGWQLTGGDVEIDDAPTTGNFRLFGMRQLTTLADAGNANEVTISQRFDVPDDALALRFVLWGGSESVQLLDADGDEIEGVTGPESDLNPVCVSWDLDTLRGERVELRITDDSSSTWGYVTISGIDLIRDVPSAITNAELTEGVTGWVVSGHGANFNSYFDSLTNRNSLSSFAQSGPALGDAAVGQLYHGFLVPEDALALRFWVHGGASVLVGISLGSTPDNVVESAVRGTDSNDQLIPVSWNLVPYRGQTMYLRLRDDETTAWGFFGTTGFDVIAGANGQ